MIVVFEFCWQHLILVSINLDVSQWINVPVCTCWAVSVDCNFEFTINSTEWKKKEEKKQHWTLSLLFLFWFQSSIIIEHDKKYNVNFWIENEMLISLSIVTVLIALFALVPILSPNGCTCWFQPAVVIFVQSSSHSSFLCHSPLVSACLLFFFYCPFFTLKRSYSHNLVWILMSVSLLIFVYTYLPFSCCLLTF